MPPAQCPQEVSTWPASSELLGPYALGLALPLLVALAFCPPDRKTRDSARDRYLSIGRIFGRDMLRNPAAKSSPRLWRRAKPPSVSCPRSPERKIFARREKVQD